MVLSPVKLYSRKCLDLFEITLRNILEILFYNKSLRAIRVDFVFPLMTNVFMNWLMFILVSGAGFLSANSMAQNAVGKGAGHESTNATGSTWPTTTTTAPVTATVRKRVFNRSYQRAPIADLNFNLNVNKIAGDRQRIEIAHALFMDRSKKMGFHHPHNCSKFVPKKFQNLLANISGQEANLSRSVFKKSRFALFFVRFHLLWKADEHV